MALTPEILIPRLGDVLVEQGLITSEQLIQALEYQKKQRLEGKKPLIGQVLVEMHLLDQKSLDQSIIRQILQLQTKLQQANETLELRVKERTAELEEAYQKLSELSELKANFVSNISHELRTPLTHINGYIDLLLTNGFGPLTKDQEDAIQVIRRASARLERLINDLILFSTSGSTQLNLEKENFNLALIEDEILENFSEMAKLREILLKKESSHSSITVYADKAKIHWVINQLVDNAIKFTPPGGEIIIRMIKDNARVTVAVVDTGIGIQSDQLEEIFEPFHQLDGSSTRKQGGTGIGLTLVKKIVEAHNSRIEVTSTPSHGSIFSFILNVVESSE